MKTAAQSCRNKKRDRVRKNSPERCISNVPPADISDGKIRGPACRSWSSAKDVSCCLTIQPVSIINVVTNHFGPGTFGDQYPAKKYESLVVVLLAVPVSGEERAGDDLTEVAWFPAEGPLPEMAFQADLHTIGQYRRCGDRFGIFFSDTENVFWE